MYNMPDVDCLNAEQQAYYTYTLGDTMFRIKTAYIMDLLPDSLGWYGRLAGSNIYVSCAYDVDGLRVSTIERVLLMIPTEQLSYQPSYEAMKKELDEHMKWPPMPTIEPSDKDKRRDLDVTVDNAVIEAIQKDSGMDRESILRNIVTAISVDGEDTIGRNIVPVDMPHSIPAIEGFTDKECREAFAAAQRDGTHLPTVRGTHILSDRSVIDLFHEAVDVVTGDTDSNVRRLRIKQRAPHIQETGTVDQVLGLLTVVPYDILLHSLEEEIDTVRQCICPGNDEHNDDVLDELKCLMTQRDVLLAEQSAHEGGKDGAGTKSTEV
jgi:hypothetical protein